MIENEEHARFIGYGAMLMESFVAVMAIIAASIIDPGIYFAVNSPAGVTGGTVETASEFVNGLGFAITPDDEAVVGRANLCEGSLFLAIQQRLFRHQHLGLRLGDSCV